MKKEKGKRARLMAGVHQLMLTLSLLLLASLANAQSKVSGTVVDTTGEPVIGASILVKGTSKGTVTDFNGNFTIITSSEGTLVFSYVGYKSQTIAINGRTTINVTLEEDATTLDDVVVIGYGSVKKRNLTAAVAKMDDKGIKDRPLARAEQALQGQLAGVTVRTVSGEPGSDQQIRVRGAASVNASSDPLYVVDGVPMTSISNLNPGDIQSIEVLKDAASAAIYGSRGSNGVVIVSTKRGKSGKPTVTFNGSVGFSQPEKKLDIMTSEEWMEFKMRWNDQNYLNQMSSKGITGASIKDDNETRMKNMGGSMAAPNYQVINDDRWFQYLSPEIQAAHTYNANAGTLDLLDWQDHTFRSAMIQNYDVSVTGGTDNLSYMVSGGYMKQEGIVVGTDYQRFNLRANLESKINKYITVGLNLAPTYITTNGAGTANGKDSYLHIIVSAVPISAAGVGYMTNVQPNERYPWAGSQRSPSFQSETNISKNKKAQFVGNAFLRITPVEDLKIELSGAANYLDTDGQSYVFTSTTANWAQGEGTQSSGGHSTSRVWTTLLQALVNYDKEFGKHGVSLMAGTSREETNIGFSTNQTYKAPFANDAITGSFNGSQVTPNANTVTERTPNNLVSVFGRAQYNYDERYMLSASLRYDGGSVFGGDNKWGVFPAVSAGWMISGEPFWKKLGLNWWNTLKLRASYGVTGNNNISNTAAYATLSAITYAGAAGYSANTLGNADLGWEKTHSTDLALDFAFLNNRVQLSLDWYTKTTKDLLYQVPVAAASGFSTIWGNLGEIKNKGLDIEVTTHNFTGKFKWDTSLNVSYNTNEVVSLGTDDTPIHSGFGGVGDGATASNILTVGKPVNAFYMYEAIGVWESQAQLDAYAKECGVSQVTFQGKTNKPGDIRYRDVNHDGDITLDNDRVFLGQPTPKWLFGMTNSFEWKGFDASILLTAQLGGKILGTLGRAIDRPSMGATSNVMDVWTNAWWSENEPGDGMTPYIFSSTTGGQVDSRWLWSSNFLSVKNLTIGYTLPIKSNILQRARIYVSCENLLRLDKYYSGYSPEISNSGASAAPGGAQAVGLDYGGYPTARIFTLGANITF